MMEKDSQGSAIDVQRTGSCRKADVPFGLQTHPAASGQRRAEGGKQPYFISAADGAVRPGVSPESCAMRDFSHE